MIEHYNAFISYKHAELDSKLAERVQHKLEHFAIPREIKKKVGMKKIERIFRDKEELPITSNLTDTITYALEHSDYLIVICTTNTRKSVWVEREIKTFLKTHSRDKILTVLGEGEPYDVIPEILLYEEKTVIDADGNEVTIKQDLEPLSCDYRVGMRKADKEELPRLASAVIGCSYDELMNRRRQYRTRRMIVVFSLVIAALFVIGAYLYITGKMIRDSLALAEERQSRYLAGESERLLADNQRIKAIQVALLAVPNENNPDIPLVPIAQRALVDSTYAYQTETSVNVGEVWNYEAPRQIKMFNVSDSRKYIAASDVTECVTVWDTETKEVVLTVPTTSWTVQEISFVGDEKLLLSKVDSFYAYDLKTGKLAWKLGGDDAYGSFMYTPVVSEDLSQIYVSSGTAGMLVVDSDTGDVLNTIKCVESNGVSQSLVGVNLSPDKSKFVSVTYGSGYGFLIRVFDLSTGENTVLMELVDIESYDVSWVDNNKVVIQTVDDNPSVNFKDGQAYIKTVNCHVKCIDINDMSIVWESDFPFHSVSSGYHIYPVPANNTVAVFCGSEMVIYDINDGHIVDAVHGSGDIVDISDRNGNGRVLAIMSDGVITMSFPDMAPDEFYKYSLFPNNIDSCVIIKDDIYVVKKDSNEVINIRFDVYDHDWHQISDEAYPLSNDFMPHSYADDEVVAFVDTDEVLVMIDPSDNSVKEINLAVKDIGTDIANNFDIEGVYDGKLYVSFGGFMCSAVYEIDIESGKMNLLYYDDFTDYGNEDITLSDNTLFYMDESDSYDLKFTLLNLDNNKSETFEVGEIDVSEVKPVYLPNAEVIVYSEETHGITFYNVDKDKEVDVELPEDWTGTIAISETPDGEVVLADNSRIVVVDNKGKITHEINGTAGRVIGIDFEKLGPNNEDIMIVALSTGYLYRYSLDDYSEIGYSQFTVDAREKVTAQMNYDSEHDLLYIKHGNTLDIIELTEWYEIASIYNAIGHTIPTNRIYTYNQASDNVTVGYFDYYSLDDLIDKAYEIIGDAELSAAEKTAYGLVIDG